MTKAIRNSAIGLMTAVGALSLSAANAVSLTITVENTQTVSSAGNGLSLTPFWVAFFESSSVFDAFSVGDFASPGVEEVAELGTLGTINSELAAAQADAVAGAVTAPGGVAGTIDPGETGTLVIEVDPLRNGWFQFLSMVVPTNDTFVGLGNSVQLFDDMGNFLGPRTFDLTLSNTYDAGTEANEFLNGAAFLANVDATGGTETNDPISQAQPTNFSAELLADGTTLLDPLLAAAFFGGVGTLGTVTVSLTPDSQAVPVPAAALLFGTALAGFGMRRRRKAQA